MIDLYVVEKAIEEQLISLEFKNIDVSRTLPDLVQPGVAVSVIGGTVDEQAETGEERLRAEIEILLVAKDIGSEENRRAQLHGKIALVIGTLAGVSFGGLSPLSLASWQEITNSDYAEKKLAVFRINFGGYAPITPTSSASSSIVESGNKSFWESVRLAVKDIFTNLNYSYIPTKGNFPSDFNGQNFFKVFYEGEVSLQAEFLHNKQRRTRTLSVILAVPNTLENWQDETSCLIEEFNYYLISQIEIKSLLNEFMKKHLGNVKIDNMSVIEPFADGDKMPFALVKVSVIIDGV